MKPRRPSQKSAAPASIDEASLEFEGRWQRLVSSTNWEKGRIISQWRAALVEQGASVQEYSDDAWCRRVGGVTGQHVGRLRRVWERFGNDQASYDGLSWSHFQAAVDWEDAEMWLEGAVQSHWSVAGMRHARWETQGAPEGQKPRPEDVIAGELDEDFIPLGDESLSSAGKLAELRPVDALTDVPGEHDTDATETFEVEDSRRGASDANAAPWEPESTETPAKSALFAGLPELPEDLAEAVEMFKLAIVRHRQDGWRDASPADVLAHLRALEDLVAAAQVDA